MQDKRRKAKAGVKKTADSERKKNKAKVWKPVITPCTNIGLAVMRKRNTICFQLSS